MRVIKEFAPKTICIDTKEDEKFITDLLIMSQEYLYSKNRWGSIRADDKEMGEKINFFKRLLGQ